MSTSDSPGSPPRKRPRSETLTLCSEDGLATIGRYTSETIQTYLTALRGAPVDLEAFSNPSKCTSLLFPSLLKSMIPSFHAPTGQYRYRHMGRPIFSSIMSEVQRLDRQTPTPVALVGTYGSGKTHLLSALASFLFTQGKRVIFLPECCLVGDDTIFWLKLAFALPFSDLPGTLEKISQFQTTEEFIEFTRSCREDIYFLVDGFDQLQADMKSVICALTSRHFHIHTTYAVDTCTPTLRGASWIRLPSGFSSIEFVEWVRHFETQLPWNLNKGFLEFHTGGIPALLRLLFKFPNEEFSDICAKLRMERDFTMIADNVVAFNTSVVDQSSAAQKKRYRELMSACLTETIPEIRSGSNTALYDPRYFYFDDSDDRGHCVCGLARETVVTYLRLDDFSLFTSDAWYSAVRSGSSAIRDSAISQIVLTRMSVGGLTQADAQGNAMRICNFRQDPNFGWMFEEAWKSPRIMSSFLCIPCPEVFMLNAVILRINPSDKTAHLIPLQITTTLTCIDLATRFFAIMWHKWENLVKEEGFKVVNTFVSVDSLTPESADVAARGVAFREKVKFVSPEYSVRNLNVGMLDPKLGRILQGEKYQTPPAAITTPK